MDVTDEAIAEALRLAGETLTVAQVRQYYGMSPKVYTTSRAILAHARTIMEAQAFRQEVSNAVEKVMSHKQAHTRYGASLSLSRFILPKPDPDEELAREVAESVDCETSLDNATVVALATIKRLREQGRLKDA